MLTEAAGAFTIAPTCSAISWPIVHQRSAQALTPRVAHVWAYSARLDSTPRGIAPSELLIM